MQNVFTDVVAAMSDTANIAGLAIFDVSEVFAASSTATVFFTAKKSLL